VLGELKTAEADALAKQAELAEAEERVRRAEEESAALGARVAELSGRLAVKRGEVAARLDALYRLGRPRYLRVLLASDDPSRLLAAYRAAAALSSRDARLMGQYRDQRAEAQAESARLDGLRPVLQRERDARQEAARQAEAALERKRALLRSIQSDRATRQAALGELQAAERSFGAMLPGLSGAMGPAVGFDKMRGVLDWPAPGRVSAGFGRSVSTRFGTPIEHSGLDIDAPFGADIRAIYDGAVVYAQWLRGYGLTVILDHGGGYMSVYSHASVLLAQKGDRVGRGQKLGLVGDSGSLRGPYLYFEIRRDGRPIDPSGWLRAR
jgi:septal ring factor EnvC (AmiA/AmiB activator)